MAGTLAGGRKARDKNIASDPDFYRKIGQRGGTISRGGGFTGKPELARKWGKIGGEISKRLKKEVIDEQV